MLCFAVFHRSVSLSLSLPLCLSLSVSPSLSLSISFSIIRTASSTFKDFELASAQQRPDSVLRRRRRGEQQQQQGPPTMEAKQGAMVAVRPSARRFVRLAVMGITVALGAAALAMVNSALEWAPKLDLQFFP